MEEICWLSASETVKAIIQKKISPVEVVNAHIRRINQYNPKFNAVVSLAADSALAEAKQAEAQVLGRAKTGPLHGVPVLVKDNVFTRGIRTTFGSLLYKDYVPDRDAILVERLKKAGAIVLGKTNLSEFGLVCISDNLVFGPTRNPWATERTPGGSSGGAAAAVALGFSALATGNDAGGSIRIPASLCGVFGLKPSFGRIPSYPRLPAMVTLTHEGPITRTVADAALMYEVMAGPDERDLYSLPAAEGRCLRNLGKGVKGLKVAYSGDLGYASVEQEVLHLTREAALSFHKLGCQVEEVDIELPDMLDALQQMVNTEVITANEDRLAEWENNIYPAFAPMISRARSISNRDLAKGQMKKEQLWEKLRVVFERYDLLLTPTSAVTAFLSGEGGPIGPNIIDGKKVRRMAWMAFTYPFNFTGQPAASVPCGFDSEGLPVGLQIVGRRFDEGTVFRAAAAFEEMCPWQRKRPNIS